MLPPLAPDILRTACSICRWYSSQAHIESAYARRIESCGWKDRLDQTSASRYLPRRCL